MSWSSWRSFSEMPKKSAKYKVVLTGHMRYFSVNGEKKDKYTVAEMYDTNPDGTDWRIYDKKGEEVEDGQLRDEIIEAVKNR